MPKNGVTQYEENENNLNKLIQQTVFHEIIFPLHLCD